MKALERVQKASRHNRKPLAHIAKICENSDEPIIKKVPKGDFKVLLAHSLPLNECTLDIWKKNVLAMGNRGISDKVINIICNELDYIALTKVKKGAYGIEFMIMGKGFVYWKDYISILEKEICGIKEGVKERMSTYISLYAGEAHENKILSGVVLLAKLSKRVKFSTLNRPTISLSELFAGEDTVAV